MGLLKKLFTYKEVVKVVGCNHPIMPALFATIHKGETRGNIAINKIEYKWIGIDFTQEHKKATITFEDYEDGKTYTLSFECDRDKYSRVAFMKK